MSAQQKRDPSQASNRMTRKNGPKDHLLSTFRNRRTPQDEAVEPKSEPEFEPEPISESKAPEPGIYDEPLSSESEDELAGDVTELPGPGDRFKENTRVVNLEAPSSPASVWTEAWSSQAHARPTRKGPMSRSFSAREDDDDELTFSFGSSQRKKRLKTQTYPTSSARIPSSSARSTDRKPSTGARKPKKYSQRATSSEADDASESSEPEAESKSKMELDDASQHNEPATKASGFIVPPLYTGDEKSSFETTSSKENEAALKSSPGISSSSPLSSAPSEIVDLLEEETDMKPPPPRKWLCPMCKEEVDPGLLLQFEAQPKQRVREQQQFCTSHKQTTAEREWQNHGYPQINWETFDQRIKQYFPELEKLLAPGHSSYYHNILSTTMKDGKAKNFRLTMAGDGIETISCGYYGTKGAAKMLQAVVDRFSATLRRLSTSDNIIKTAGVAGYAQSVLVPELAACLVKDDMRVDDDTARQILRESIDLGQKINPALDDEVPIPVEDDA